MKSFIEDSSLWFDQIKNHQEFCIKDFFVTQPINFVRNLLEFICVKT